MAIQTLKGKKTTTWRSYWRNPITKKIEYSPVFQDELDAVDFDTKIKRRIRDDPDSFADGPVVSKDVATFERLGHLYLQRPELTESTLETTVYTLDKEVNPDIGKLLPEAITKDHLKRLEAKWRAKGNKQPTLNRKISVILAIMNWALTEGHIKTNPVDGYKCRRGESEEIPPPSPAELSRIFASAAPHLQRVIVLGSALGARVGETELFKIRWEDVDFDRNFVRVWSAAKNRRLPYRNVPVSTSLIEILRSWMAQDGPKAEWIVSYLGAPVKSVKRAWAAALAKAGVTRRLRPYDLRHYFCTETLASGADLKAVSELMGHATTRMVLEKYQHVLTEQRRRVGDLIEVPGVWKKPAPAGDDSNPPS